MLTQSKKYGELHSLTFIGDQNWDILVFGFKIIVEWWKPWIKWIISFWWKILHGNEECQA